MGLNGQLYFLMNGFVLVILSRNWADLTKSWLCRWNVGE